MHRDQLIKLSKLLSLMLRHEPDRFGLTLDAEGYVALDLVLVEVQRKYADAALADIQAVIESIEPDKKRFSIIGDDIRANYGHSIADRIVHQEIEPPEVLWHGTNAKSLDGILQVGLLPMRRQYVHLTTDPQLAIRVGSRRGEASLLTVNAKGAFSQGIKFYRANESFWLVDEMPACYLSIES